MASDRPALDAIACPEGLGLELTAGWTAAMAWALDNLELVLAAAEEAGRVEYVANGWYLTDGR